MAILSAIESISAIILLSWTLVTILTRLTESRSQLSIIDLVSLIFTDITDMIIVICICLSFKFVSVDKQYKLMCGKFHHCVLMCCQRIAIQKIVKRYEIVYNNTELSG